MIKYINGDATNPEPKEGVIAHVCNDLGAWGKGFVLAIDKRWPSPRFYYKQFIRNSRGSKDSLLGKTRFVAVEADLLVANMIAQRGIKTPSNPSPLDLDALTKCLNSVAEMADLMGYVVHMPRIGCGLGGSSWEAVGPVVENCMKGIEVIIYDYDASGKG